MSISVIIPTRNYAHFLSHTLHCVLAQEVSVPVEVIVVDDGSIDDTANVVQTAIAPYGKRIAYIYQENQGVCTARNVGIAHATGQTVLFLDADDLLLPGALQSQWDTLGSHPNAHISLCRNVLARGAGPEGALTPIGYYPLHTGSYSVHICDANIAPIHAFLVRRATVAAVGGFDISQRATEDYDFWLRCLHTGARIVPNPDATVVYRKHDGGITAQHKHIALHEARMCMRVADMLAEAPTFLEGRRADAALAHAVGALRRTKNAARHGLSLTASLLDMAMDAVHEAARYAAYRANTPVLSRNEPENDVLRYYALKALVALGEIAAGHPQTGHPRLPETVDILKDLCAQWGFSCYSPEEDIVLLRGRIHIPQELSTLSF